MSEVLLTEQTVSFVITVLSSASVIFLIILAIRFAIASPAGRFYKHGLNK